MLIKIRVAFAAILCISFLTTTANAFVFTTLDGNGADIHVSEQSSGGDGTSNQTDERLFFRTRHDSLFRHEVTYLRFDLSSVGGTINDAALEMYQLAGGNTDFDMYGLNDDPSEIGGGAWDWEEATATYNSVPGISMSDGDGLTSEIIPGEVTDLGVYNHTTTDLVTKSFSSAAITAFLNADTNGVVTFILESQSTGASIFRSSRTAFNPGEHPPRLNLTGPEIVLDLIVDRTTGQIVLENNTGPNYNIDGYRVTSSGGSLDAAGWNSLDDQAFDGDAWTELSSSANGLLEGSFSTSSIIANGTSANLGLAYDTAVDAEDLVFEIHTAGDDPSSFEAFAVTYFSSVMGDMNGDGVVDTDDVNPFVQALTNRAAYDAEPYAVAYPDIIGDVNGDDVFNLGDIAAFKTLVSGGGSAAASSVPEPMSLMLLAMGAVSMMLFRRR